MGIGGFFSNESNSTQKQFSSTDEGIIAQSGATVARDGSIGVGKGGSYSEAGSVQAKRDANLGNVTAQKGATVTVGLTGADVSSLVNQLTTANQAQLDAANQLAKDQQDQIGTLAENSQTGGDKSKNNTIAWLAAAAIVGAIWLGSQD